MTDSLFQFRRRVLVWRRFIVVLDHDGISISWPGGKRLAVWVGGARRKYGCVEIFKPWDGWTP